MTARDTPHSTSPIAVFVFIVIGPSDRLERLDVPRPAAEDERADGGDPEARADGEARGGTVLRAIAGAGGL